MPDRAVTMMSLIAAQSSRSAGTAGFLERVCRAAAQALAASGSGISVSTDDGILGVCAASDAHSERIEELQFVLGEGPCIDASDSRRPVLVADLAADGPGRWPMYAHAARDGGVQAIFAFPLQVGGARLGVLDVFHGRTGNLSADQLANALTFADIIVAFLLDQQESVDVAGAVNGTAEAVEGRAELFQAQGMVMVQMGGTISEAMVRMRAHAYAEGCAIGDIARDVVARRLRFDPDGP